MYLGPLKNAKENPSRFFASAKAREGGVAEGTRRYNTVHKVTAYRIHTYFRE